MTAARGLPLHGALLLLALLWLFSSSAPAQKEECLKATKYYLEENGLCCSRCPPGHYASEKCNPEKDTVCLQCADNTFTEFWNYVPACYRCSRCDTVLGFEVALPCNFTHKTKCSCMNGTHCVSGDTPGECTHCEADSECPPGKEVSSPGNGVSDTVCIPCQQGFYQNVSSAMAVCQPHTDCRALDLQMQVPGSAISDSVCVPVFREEPDYRTLIIILSLSAVALLSTILVIFCFARENLCRKLKNLVNGKPQQPAEQTFTDTPSPNSPTDPLLPDSQNASEVLGGASGPTAMQTQFLEKETLLNNESPQRNVPQAQLHGYREALQRGDPPEESSNARHWQEEVNAGTNTGFQMNGRSMTFNGNVYIYNGMGARSPESPTDSSPSNPEPPLSWPGAGGLRLVTPQQEDGKEQHISVEENWRGMAPFPI
ncbi:tumor necrosis factor receptor superfamily member 3-like isoform X2 [Rhinatrema bivittatum]|uniref:tumor necrosis factor receptor superfamily member 3-like isoform X2 n=1 Tax=Rhinatrema bivittatum TaxID=194408 RepID=UPI001128164A|nr:tumor necrosis factor receptor superfamily member 3-like isoform X2 [Rhinatrema bivittatum]